MAKGDTKTNQYLDIAANGARADLPSDTCCETRSQTLIREVAERIMDVEDEVEELKNNPDVVDVVATYADLQAYDTQHLTDKDIIRVLQDETHDGESTYYRYNKQSGTWTYVGTVGDYYTKTAADAKFQDKLTAGSNITISEQNVISATDTTYSDFTGTDGTAAGVAGLVPAPATTDAGKFLKADGTWDDAAGSTYTAGDGIDITNDVIKATNTGKARVLTTDDYNWPTSNPTSVALWLLDDGLYSFDNLSVRYNSFVGYTGTGMAIVNKATESSDPGDGLVLYMPTGDPAKLSRQIRADGSGSITSTVALTVVQTTGTSTTGVMSQNAVTSMVFADPSTKRRVQIGNTSNYGTSAITIGNTASTYGNNSISIGGASQANAAQAIAFAGGRTTTQGVMQIGINQTGWEGTGYNSSAYRLLTGLYDGQSAHDAVNLGQLQNAIINGGTTVPTTATVGAVGTLYSYVDTTGTPTPHMMVCTAADTTDPSNPVYTWQTLV